MSEDKLTDPDIRLNDLEAYLEKDKVLSNEIALRKKRQVIVDKDLEGETKDGNYDEPNEDDSVVPIELVAEKALKIRLPGGSGLYCTHSKNVKLSETSHLLYYKILKKRLINFFFYYLSFINENH